MDHKDVRRGVTEAKRNDSASTWVFVEILLIAFLCGILTLNFVVGILVFFVLGVMFWFKKTTVVLLVILTILNTAIAAVIGFFIFGIIGSIVCGVIGLILSMIIHMSTFNWSEDIRKR